MQKIIEAARREQLGQEMVGDLLDIAQLTGQPIKHMLLNSIGVFEEAKDQKKAVDGIYRFSVRFYSDTAYKPCNNLLFKINPNFFCSLAHSI